VDIVADDYYHGIFINFARSAQRNSRGNAAM